MRISFEENEKDVIFLIGDFDEKYVPVFKSCFWQEENGSYFKSFPKDSKHIDDAKENFRLHAKEMFDQLGYFSECKWEEALYDFALRMKENMIDWWLTGSCTACIRGVALKPHDVDAMFSSKDVDRIADVFPDKIIHPILDTNGWVTRDFGVLFWHARIDLASDPVAKLDKPEPIDCGPYARGHLETIRWRGLDIKVPPIELTLAANKRRKRFERAKLIEDFLRSKE